MQFDIQARGFPLTPGLRDRAERRLRFALGSRVSGVDRLSIRLGDENGPRGGIDMRCTICARLPGSPAIVIEQRDSDLYAAIDQAADRLRRTLSRRLQKGAGVRRAGRTGVAHGRPAVRDEA